MRFRSDNTTGYDAVALASLNAAFYTILADNRASRAETDGRARKADEDSVAEALLRRYDNGARGKALLRAA